MRHYLLLGDDGGVLGVWETGDAQTATRLRLELALSYPGCRTVLEQATSFDAFKARITDFDLEDIEPEPALVA